MSFTWKNAKGTARWKRARCVVSWPWTCTTSPGLKETAKLLCAALRWVEDGGGGCIVLSCCMFFFWKPKKKRIFISSKQKKGHIRKEFSKLMEGRDFVFPRNGVFVSFGVPGSLFQGAVGSNRRMKWEDEPGTIFLGSPMIRKEVGRLFVFWVKNWLIIWKWLKTTTSHHQIPRRMFLTLNWEYRKNNSKTTWEYTNQQNSIKSFRIKIPYTKISSSSVDFASLATLLTQTLCLSRKLGHPDCEKHQVPMLSNARLFSLLGASLLKKPSDCWKMYFLQSERNKTDYGVLVFFSSRG